MICGASFTEASTIITTPYNGADLFKLTTANNGSPGGIATPGTGSVSSPSGVTYLIQDGDGGPAALFDGTFGGNKFFSGGMSNPTSVPMGGLIGATNPTATSGWKWFDAHFSNSVVISNFVLCTADHAYDRTPDQFQLRGSNNGGATWDVIYRYDNNASNGSSNPWGTVANGSIPPSPPNNTAVKFIGGGVDFATPAAYSRIRLEVFSVTQGDGVGLTEWQLAGAPPSAPAAAFWNGTSTATWNSVANWATSTDGLTAVALLPGATTDVSFVSSTASEINTTLDGVFSIKSLNFTSAATTPVTISGSGTSSINLGTGGLNVSADSANHQILSSVVLALNQTWSIGGSSVLTIDGNLSGVGIAWTKEGTGRLILNGQNNNSSGSILINSGTLEVNGAITGTNSIRVATGSILEVGPSSIIAGNIVVSGGEFHHAGRLTSGSTLTLTSGSMITAPGVATVGRADFSSLGGIADASTTPLSVAVQAQLRDFIRLNYTAGGGSTAFSLQGNDVADNSATRTLALAGGTLSFSIQTASAPTYRHYRFSVSEVNASDLLQLSELHYYNNGVWIPATATYSGSPDSESEHLGSNTNDNNQDTKYTAPASYSWALTYDFGSSRSLSAYNWATANDSAPSRNPTKWKVEGSSNGTTWTTIDDRSATTQSGPNSIYTWAGVNPANYAAFGGGGSANAYPLSVAVSGGSIQLPNSNVSVTATSQINLGDPSQAHTLGSLSILGGGTTLVVANAQSVHFTGASSHIDAGAILDTNGVDIVINSISGDGSITNNGLTANSLTFFIDATPESFTGNIGGGSQSIDVIKTGAESLTLAGNQTYDALTVSDGTLNVNGVLGSGSTAVIVNDTPLGISTQLRFGGVSQNLASLSIGEGALVTFSSNLGSAAVGSSKGVATVPEPSSLSLLMLSVIGFLHRQSSRQLSFRRLL